MRSCNRARSAGYWTSRLLCRGVTDAAIFYEVGEGIATLTLNRPDRLNAITWPMIEHILDALERCRTDDAVRLLVFRGAGRPFSSGDHIGQGIAEPTRAGDPPAVTL